MASIMVGSVVVTGEGWLKLRSGDSFVSFWTGFRYAIVETILITTLLELFGPLVADLIRSNLIYLPGMISFMVGTFLAWFIYSVDLSFRTQGKIVWILACYTVSIVNMILPNVGR